MPDPKILVFAGSTRKDSCNKKLAKTAANYAQNANAEVTYIDLADYPMPLYDGDIENEKGLPENALKLKKLMEASDAIIISSPEYNSSISGVLKNAIDWASRQATKDDPSLSAFTDKVALLISASPSGLGGLRGLVHLRSILQNINMIVLPGQKCLSNAYDAFDEKGELKSDADKKAVEKLVSKLVAFTRKIKAI